MYERKDVPKADKNRSKKALIVLVVLACVLGGGFYGLWQLAKSQTSASIADSDLAQGVSDIQLNKLDSDEVEPSKDNFYHLLILEVDDINAKNKTLNKAIVLSINKQQNTGTVVTLPSEVQVLETKTLGDIVFSDSMQESVSYLAKATHIPFSHVIVANNNFIDKLKSLGTQGASALANQAPEMLKSIKTDMGISDLMEIAEMVHGTGFESLKKIGSDSFSKIQNNSGMEVIDPQKLGIEIGTLIKK